MSGETTAGTGLGKATGRGKERLDAPEAVVGAGAGEGVTEELAAPTTSAGDAEALRSSKGAVVWLLSVLVMGFGASEID